MVTGCLFLAMSAFLLSICTFLTWQNCCKGRYQWKKTLHPDTAIAKLGFGKIRVTKVRQLSRTGWSHLLPVWDDSGPGCESDTAGADQSRAESGRQPSGSEDYAGISASIYRLNTFFVLFRYNLAGIRDDVFPGRVRDVSGLWCR